MEQAFSTAGGHQNPHEKHFQELPQERAGDKQEPGQASALQLSGQELSRARSCFKASSPALTGSTAPGLFQRREMGPGTLPAGTLLSHSRSRAASRNELQGDVISVSGHGQSSAWCLLCLKPSKLPSDVPTTGWHFPHVAVGTRLWFATTRDLHGYREMEASAFSALQVLERTMWAGPAATCHKSICLDEYPMATPYSCS